MLGLGLSLTQVAARGGGGFNPASLYRNGEQGAVYDPSDLRTLFQDSAGTTPAVVDQPVGLMLDKRLGLVRGPELVENGDFSQGLEGWAAYSPSGHSTHISGGRLTLTAITASATGRYIDVPVPSNTSVEITIADVVVSNAESGVWLGADASFDMRLGSYYGQSRTIHRIVETTGITSIRVYIKLRGSPLGEVTFGPVSVRELPGNHASQETATARPILRQDEGGFYYLEPDGVDDFMTALSMPTLDQPTTYAVAFQSDQASIGNVFDSVATSSPGRQVLGMASASTYRIWAGTTLTAPRSNIQNPHVLIGIFNGDSSGIYLDSDPEIAGGAGTNPLQSGLSLFARGLDVTQPFQGRFYAGLVINRAITDAERLLIQKWLASKSGASL